MKVIDAALRAIQHFGYHQIGKCNICGHTTFFVCIDSTVARNNMYCSFCLSSSRKRHVAKILLQQISPEIQTIVDLASQLKINIYNGDTDDSFYKVLQNSNNYTCSSFDPDIPPGTEIKPRVYCQDLENLTFASESFDVVMTEDVFEHVRNHSQGFKEVYRVLKPGGYHIFTVPCYFDRPTVIRVDTSGQSNIHLLPPEYHGDKIRGQILAYRTFGIDIFDFLLSLGFETTVDFSSYSDKKSGIFDSYVFCSRKVPQPNR